MPHPDLIQLILIGTPISVAILAAALRSQTLVVWVLSFAGVAVATSALNLYATRIPLTEPEIWLGVLSAEVFPIAVASTLTRWLSPTTRKWLIAFAALASYIAALFLGITVGGGLGAIVR